MILNGIMTYKTPLVIGDSEVILNGKPPCKCGVFSRIISVFPLLLACTFV